MSGTTPKPLATYTITVGTEGTFTNDANTDISATLNAEIAAAPQGDHININFEPGDYAISTSIFLPSNTSVIGNDATVGLLNGVRSSSMGGGMFVNADAYYAAGPWTQVKTTAGNWIGLYNYNVTPSATGSTPDVIDNDISVQGMTFNEGGASVFGTWFTNATNIDVQNNVYIGGVDGNAFVNVTNSVVAQNLAIGQNNAAFDNWNGPTNITVELNSDLMSGATNTGWSVLLNSTPSGDPNNPGNAVNDGIVGNLFASLVPNSLSVLAYALTSYGFTTESDITQQGNIDSMFGIPGEAGVYTGAPMSNLTVQDEIFSGLNDISDTSLESYAIDIANTDNAVVTGNLVAGDASTENTPAIQNTGNSPITSNNAVISADSGDTGLVQTSGLNGTLSSEGNISEIGGQISGSGALPLFDIVAPTQLDTSVDGISSSLAISISDLTQNDLVSVTLMTTFDTLSLPDNTTGVTYTTVYGQSAIVITGSNDQVNEDLSELSITSNNCGFDDSLEIIAASASGSTAIRYVPLVVDTSLSNVSEITTLTPQEFPTFHFSPITFSNNISVVSLSDDTVIASTGNNVISLGNSISVVLIGAGNDSVTGGDQQGYITTGSGDDQLFLTGGGDITATGGSGSMQVVAATGDDLIEGGLGYANVDAGTGADTVLAGLGDVSVTGGSGSLLVETLPQDAGDLSVSGGSGSSTILALSGNDQITTEANTANLILVGIGQSTVWSGGLDIIFTGAGDSTIDASPGGVDLITGGSGRLVFVGGDSPAVIAPANFTTLHAGAGNLAIGNTGSFILDISALPATSRDIVLPNLSNGVSITGFGTSPIETEYLDGQDINLKLSDGTSMQIADPTSQAVTVTNDLIVFDDYSVTENEYYIDASALPGFGEDQGINDRQIIEQAISQVPVGDKIILVADGQSGAGLVVDGTLPLDPTVLTVQGPLTGIGNILIDGESELILNGSVSNTETISFEANAGEINLGAPTAFNGTISSISGNDIVDLTNISYNKRSRVTLLQNNVLQIDENGIAIDLHLDKAGNYSQDIFHIFSDGLNGTDVSEATVPCFLKGTRIKTPSGEVNVERLTIGDLVCNESGQVLPIKWIGRRSYSLPLPDGSDIIPVLIKAGAISDNVPSRDLFVSPSHGLKIGELIVPAGSLINSVSILPWIGSPNIEYYHIEMDSHEIILANDMPVETFLDIESRRMFDNAEEYYKIYRHQIKLEHAFCLPRLEGGRQLETMRRAIALRAGVLPDVVDKTEIVGFLESVDRQTIMGWAFDQRNPHVPVTLEILNGSRMLASVVANSLRPDVKRAGFGNGRSGFSVTLPAPLPALQRHEISVRPRGGSALLSGSPIVIDPAISHDLIRAGGLQVILEGAERGLASERDAAAFGELLVAFGTRILENARQPIGKLNGRPGQKVTKGKPFLLLLDEAWPVACADAGSSAIRSHIEAFFLLGYRVIFCATAGPPKTEQSRASLGILQSEGIECFGQDGRTVEAILRDLSQRDVRLIYLHRLAVSAPYGTLTRQIFRGAQIIYALADLHHLRLARQATVTKRPDLAERARTVREAEIWSMRMADCVLTHSRFELEFLRRTIPGVNVSLVPWAFETEERRKNLRKLKDIAFIGGGAHAPNADAVRYLIDHILPIIWEKLPVLKCYIVGAEWEGISFSGVDDRVIFTGHLADLCTILNSVRLTVAPLRFGAGIKGKVLESMASGTPCIMTQVAAEGLPLDGTLQFAVADGDLFAGRLVEIYRDPKMQRILAQAGLDMIKTYFSKEVVLEALRHATGAVAGKIQNVEPKSSDPPYL